MIQNFIKSDLYFYLGCIDELEKHNIKVSYFNDENYAGSFDDLGKELVINTSYDDMNETFVHEFCHFEQWKEQCNVWKNREIDGVDSGHILDNFLNLYGHESQKKIDILLIIEACKRIAQLELDCEKRVVEKIKKYNLKIDISDYIRKSNCYVCCYYLIPEFKCWMKNRPYSIKDKLPDSFEINHNMWANVLMSEYKDIFMS